MDCYIGIDLGSTTTKAIYLDENEQILGRGITNSRSNYELACDIANDEAGITTRFSLLKRRIESAIGDPAKAAALIERLLCEFKLAEHRGQLAFLKETCQKQVASWSDRNIAELYRTALDRMFTAMAEGAKDIFSPGAKARSDFFRDLASSEYLEQAEKIAKELSLSFDRLTHIYDSAILIVEGRRFTSAFADYLQSAAKATVGREEFASYAGTIRAAADYVGSIEFRVINMVGTGYGRQTLPFPKHQIRSEILCHGLGAHFMFPNTRTVLDIGGQDTKAIQVDPNGIVTNFQMNDRCAAGCGRYLGYIADEMNMGLHELGPMALKAKRTVKINSTCTVFAGAELRERLALGERREDILAGLHRAIILRAMSLLARSGGIRNEFTFTGGVAKNQAATACLKKLVEENYGTMTINISPDSIYTGSYGAALFSKRDQRGELANVDLNALKRKGK